MFISIIYILTVVFLFYSFIKVKKTDKEINFIFSLFISFLLFFCYNSVICYILNIFYIPINLISLSMINFIFSIILNIKRKTNKQKYKLEKIDIVAFIIFIIITIMIGFFRFGFPVNVVYETSDPGVHFWTSLDFFRNSSLLNHITNPIVDFSTRQFGSYVNLGVLFKIFGPFIGEVNLCNIYILFDLLMLFMSMMMFYILIRLICNKINKFILIFASVLYMLGYPLNNMIFGFFYSGHAVTIINLILVLIFIYKNKLINNRWIIFYLFLTNIGLFFTYYFYTPFIFIGIFLLFLHENKHFNKNFIFKIFITLILPFLLGIIYFVIPNIGNNEMNIIKQINLDGYFYNDVISNFIIFIPFVLYYILDNIKNKKIDFCSIILIILIIFMLLFTILIFLNLAVFYYLSKFYYVLWLLMFLITLLCINDKLNKLLSKICFSLYFLLFILASFNLENIMMQKNNYSVNKRGGSNILDIYYYNFNKIKHKDYILNNSEIKMLNDIYKLNPVNLITNNQVLYQRIWIDALFKKEKIDYPENQLYTYIIAEYSFDLFDDSSFEFMDDKYNYYLIFYRQSNPDYFTNLLDFSYDFYYKLDNNFKDKYIDNKIKYENINQSACEFCKFYNFDAGLFIIK